MSYNVPITLSVGSNPACDEVLIGVISQQSLWFFHSLGISHGGDLSQYFLSQVDPHLVLLIFLSH